MTTEERAEQHMNNFRKAYEQGWSDAVINVEQVLKDSLSDYSNVFLSNGNVITKQGFIKIIGSLK